MPLLLQIREAVGELVEEWPRSGRGCVQLVSKGEEVDAQSLQQVAAREVGGGDSLPDEGEGIPFHAQAGGEACEQVGKAGELGL